MTQVQTVLKHGSKAFTALLVLAFVFTSVTQAHGASSPDNPANKVAASGSTVEVVGPQQDKILMSERIKVSDPTDLIIGVTLECSILTNLTTTGDGQAGAQSQADVWIEIDDVRVPVSMDDQGDNDTDDPTLPGLPVAEHDTDGVGEVTFCNRAYQRTTSGFDDANESDNQIKDYLATKAAHGFTWLSLDPSRFMDAGDDNILKVEVVADLDSRTQSSGDDAGETRVVVGNRTLIIEPVKAAVGEAVTEVGVDS